MHWLDTQWFGYWWPSDKGNGPEAIQQIVLGAVVVAIFVPPIRAWFRRHVKALHEKLDLAHQKMDHIILHHPDIPPFGGDVVITSNTPHARVGRDDKGRFTKRPVVE